MKIGEVSRKLKIPVSTIRFYERKKLLEPVSRFNGIREFSENDLVQIAFIQKAQVAGFSLREIGTLLQVSREQQALGPALSELANRKRDEIRKTIRTLKEIDRFLQQLTFCECPTVEKCDEKNCMRN